MLGVSFLRMKIGIITYWQSKDNYGQLLQCFALQKYFDSLGHEAYLIRYDFINRILPRNKLKILIKCLLLYPIVKHFWQKNKDTGYNLLISEIDEKNKQRCFDSFREEHLVKSHKVYKSLCELQENPPMADLYVTGSDQVWSQLLNLKENEVFFLNFGNNETKRISYAASFAMDKYPRRLYKILKENLDRFQAVSVREKVGVNICSDVGVPALLVVDPTLLLNSHFYRKLSCKCKHSNFVYIYSLNISKADELYYDSVKQMCDKRNYNIIVTPASGCVPGLELFSGVVYDYATIPEWLSNIDNASLVVTTSFHGVVFCILFHTQFVYIPLKGSLSKMNNRVLNLLNELGLNDMVATSGSKINEIADKKINWANVDDRLNEMKISSEAFLKHNCNESTI